MKRNNLSQHTSTLSTHCIHTPHTQASEHQKQLSQVREEVNSLNIKLKWAQGKLKTETEAHNVSITSNKPSPCYIAPHFTLPIVLSSPLFPFPLEPFLSLPSPLPTPLSPSPLSLPSPSPLFFPSLSLSSLSSLFFLSLPLSLPSSPSPSSHLAPTTPGL